MIESLSGGGKEAGRNRQTKPVLPQTGVRGRSVHLREPPGADTSILRYFDNKPIFSIVMVHEDGLSARRARHFYNGLVQDPVDACNFRLNRWSFRAIAIP
jgi:hypothetical protein